MATGDNTLTAISVGRECNIIKKQQEVFFGDVQNGQVVWRRAQGLDENEEKTPLVDTNIKSSNSILQMDNDKE